MNWREFFSSVIDSAAWPLALVILVVLFHGKLLEAIKGSGPVQSLKAGPGGVEVSWFDRTVESAQENLREDRATVQHAADVSTVSPQAFELGDGFMDEMSRLGLVSARSVVSESAVRLENYLRTLLIQNDVLEEKNSRVALGRLTELAVKAEMITEYEHAALRDVVTLRNTVAHESKFVIDLRRALSFADLVQQTVQTIWHRQTD